MTVPELNPPPRLLMGPGPVGVDPRVLRAMSMPGLGQFNPAFTAYMNDTMTLTRQIFRTKNQWSLVVDGTARAGIEAILVSLITPGDKVLVPIFGRFGHLLTEIAQRCGGRVATIEREWGTVFTSDEIEDAIKKYQPRVIAVVHGDTSTTMVQPLAEIGAMCRQRDIILYSDATATLGRSKSMPGNLTPSAPACRSVCPARPARRRSHSASAALRSPAIASILRQASSRRDSSTATGRACSRTISTSRC